MSTFFFLSRSPIKVRKNTRHSVLNCIYWCEGHWHLHGMIMPSSSSQSPLFTVVPPPFTLEFTSLTSETPLSHSSSPLHKNVFSLPFTNRFVPSDCHITQQGAGGQAGLDRSRAFALFGIPTLKQHEFPLCGQPVASTIATKDAKRPVLSISTLLLDGNKWCGVAHRNKALCSRRHSPS